jgi:hypothetical protein
VQKINQSDNEISVYQKSDPLALSKSLIGAETNLELIGYFSPTAKRKGRPKNEKVLEKTEKVEGETRHIRVSIVPSAKYGRPITSDLDMYRAFFKILKEVYFKNGKIENPVVFRDEDIIKAMGKARKGRLNTEIADWMKRMMLTGISSEQWIFDKKKKRRLSETVSVFNRVASYGEELEGGQRADRNYIWLADWFLNNLNEGYIFLIDYETYRNFNHSISKCLYGLLWWGFYAIKEVDAEFYWKDYGELCRFLDITEYNYESKILEKLGPPHDELLKYKIIAKWEICKQASGKGFNIKWWPGAAFNSYYASSKKFLKDGQMTLDGIFPKQLSGDGNQSEPAEKLISYFHREVKGKTEHRPNEKELQRALELLAKYDKEQAWLITKYAVKKIKHTGFKAEQFGAVLLYAEEALDFCKNKSKQKQQASASAEKAYQQKVTEYEKWLSQSPGERVQGRLNFWIEGQKKLKHRAPTAAEIEAKQAEYIETEPTPDEKQIKLFGRVVFK